MTTLPISVVVLTKNEERVLERTLSSVASFAQVFVVDSASEDGTCSIAKEWGAEVINFTWDGKYPKKKEWALTNLPFSHDWVLYLDADEFVTEGLRHELTKLVSQGSLGDKAAYDVPLSYFFLGRQLKHGHRVVKRALVDRRRVNWPHPDDLHVVNMWEVEGHYQPNCDGPVGKLQSRLAHEDLDPLYDYFARHNRYSDWEAEFQKSSTEVRSAKRTLQGEMWRRTPFKPAIFFVYAYIVRAGFLDGRAGLHYAIANSFYYWQIALKSSAR